MNLADPSPAELDRLAMLRGEWSEHGATVDDKAAPDLLPLADLGVWARTQPKPKPFIWAGRIPKGEITLWTGAGGSNKSTAGQQLAICRAAGLPFLGVDLAPGKTLYVTAEDDFERLHWVGDHICRAVGVDPASLSDALFLSTVRGQLNNELATFDHEGRIATTPAFARVKATLRATGADLAILDNVAHLYAGNENDRAQVTAFVNLLYSLGVTVLLIAHPNKKGETYSGSTAWLNAIRSQLVVECPDELDPDARALTVGKANYARPGETLHYRWHDFALWLEDDLPADTRAEIADCIRVNGENDAFLSCLRARVEQGEGRLVGSSPGPNYAPAQFEGMAQAKGLKRDALKRAMERLFNIGAIESHTYRNTAKGRDVTVIQEVSQPPPNSTPNCSRTLIPNTPEQSARTTPRTHSPLKGGTGAASKAAAPDDGGHHD